jgi:hypothetical protein
MGSVLWYQLFPSGWVIRCANVCNVVGILFGVANIGQVLVLCLVCCYGLSYYWFALLFSPVGSGSCAVCGRDMVFWYGLMLSYPVDLFCLTCAGISCCYWFVLHCLPIPPYGLFVTVPVTSTCLAVVCLPATFIEFFFCL